MKKITCNLILLFFLFCLPATVLAAYKEIKTIEVDGLTSMPESELLYLLGIKKGAVITESAFNAGVKRAFLTGFFDDIIIESLDPDATAILVRVREKPVIGSITVTGNEHFSTGFIKKQLPFKSGERLTGLKISSGVSTLREAMRKRGFVNADVSITEAAEKKAGVDIDVTVSEGAPELVRRIEIPSEAEIVDKYLTLSPGSIYDITEMERFKGELLKYYKKQDFVGTTVSYKYQNGLLTIDVEPGTKLSIVFKGNSAVSTEDLMKEAPFFEINEVSDELIEETVASIESLYLKNGFIFAEVTPIISRSPGATLLQIFISEGDRYTVGGVTFEGSSLPQDKLMDIVSARVGDYYNPNDLESERDRLIDFYHSLGYPYVEVGEPEITIHDNKAGINFVINEKQQVKITGIEITGAKSISPDEIKKAIPLKTGNPYNEVDIAESQRKIVELCGNHGYLDAKITVNRKITGTSAVVTFDVSEGEMTLFGRNVIIGNDKTRLVVVERELIHKAGMPFSYNELLQEKQRLYHLGLFSDVEVTPSEREDGTRDVIYRLKEANAGAVEYGVGYGEYEKYRAFLELSYRNLFGMDRTASFTSEFSSIEKRFILSYAEPFFYLRDLTLKASILYESKRELNIDTHQTSYRLTRDTASAGVEKKLSDTIKGSLNYDFSVVKTKDVDPDIILSREDTGSLIISGLRPELIYDTRDNPFNPKTGILAGFSFKVASYLLLSQTDFLKLQLYANKYQKLSDRLVLALSLRGGMAQGYRTTDSLPIVERFFLGGRTTVRGYDQDTLGPKGADSYPIGGNAFLMGNFEIRTDVGHGFGIVNFVDTGNVWEKIPQVDIAQLRFTTGLGFTYNTPVGPLIVEYGVKLSREKGESLGAIHFSIGHAF